MIKTSFNSQANQATIILQPNHSWTWRANLYLIASLLVISLTVGVVLTWVGYWMILVFTTAEIAILTLCLYYCVARTHRQEVLHFTKDRLVVESGTRKPEQRVNIQRFFARFFVQAAPSFGYKRRVSLRYGNEVLEIGGFLAEPEKDALISILRNTIARLDRHPAPH